MPTDYFRYFQHDKAVRWGKSGNSTDNPRTSAGVGDCDCWWCMRHFDTHKVAKGSNRRPRSRAKQAWRRQEERDG